MLSCELVLHHLFRKLLSQWCRASGIDLLKLYYRTSPKRPNEICIRRNRTESEVYSKYSSTGPLLAVRLRRGHSQQFRFTLYNLRRSTDSPSVACHQSSTAPFSRFLHRQDLLVLPPLPRFDSAQQPTRPSPAVPGLAFCLRKSPALGCDV